MNPYFFQGPATLPGLFESLLGGLFLVKGVPLLGQLAVLALLALSFWLAWHPPASRRGRALQGLALAALFTLIALYLLQPWDEVFINLRHSQHWAQDQLFSFNRGERLEGTVEFLPYWLIGQAARWGLPVVDGAYLLGVLCGLLSIAVGLRIWRAWDMPGRGRWALLLVLYPPLAYNASHGFGASAFLLTVLVGVYGVFLRPWPGGWVALALLPLVRVEGALLVALLWALWTWQRRPPLSRALLLGVGLALPAIAHAVVRFQYYGEWLPLPVVYKSTLGSGFFLLVGLRNLLADLVATHGLAALLALASLRRACRSAAVTSPFAAAGRLCIVPGLLWCLGVFSLPYYLSGGDWFPSYWGRYLLPFNYVLWLCAVAGWSVAAPSLPAAALRRGLALPLLFLAVSSLWPISSTWKMVDHLFSHRRTLAMVHEPTIARGHYRIQHLSRLGTLLKRSSEPSDRIGSSELATIMFFAERDAVDFLGLVNPVIARSPLRPLPSFVRRFPFRSELPYLIFRRLRPDWIEKTLPEFLFTFDFMLRDQIPEVRPYEVTPTDLLRALNRWNKQLGGLMDPLYGGLERIQKLGYVPVLVRSGDDFVTLYFVHERVRSRHFAALERLGYRGQSIGRLAQE